MKISSSFLLLAFIIAAATSVQKGDDTELHYETKEAKVVSDKLGEYLTNMYLGLRNYIKEISTTCSASVSLITYKNMLEKAKGTRCTGRVPQGYKTAVTTIAEAVEKCAANDAVEDLAAFIKEIEKALTKLETLDLSLDKITKECESKSFDLFGSCASKKQKAIDELNDIISTSEQARYSNMMRKGYFNTKNIVDSCVNSATKSLETSLDAATTTIKSCLQSKKLI